MFAHKAIVRVWVFATVANLVFASTSAAPLRSPVTLTNAALKSAVNLDIVAPAAAAAVATANRKVTSITNTKRKIAFVTSHDSAATTIVSTNMWDRPTAVQVAGTLVAEASLRTLLAACHRLTWRYVRMPTIVSSTVIGRVAVSASECILTAALNRYVDSVSTLLSGRNDWTAAGFVCCLAVSIVFIAALLDQDARGLCDRRAKKTRSRNTHRHVQRCKLCYDRRYCQLRKRGRPVYCIRSRWRWFIHSRKF